MKQKADYKAKVTDTENSDWWFVLRIAQVVKQVLRVDWTEIELHMQTGGKNLVHDGQELCMLWLLYLSSASEGLEHSSDMTEFRSFSALAPTVAGDSKLSCLYHFNPLTHTVFIRVQL